jgi:hypothetical protein
MVSLLFSESLLRLVMNRWKPSVPKRTSVVKLWLIVCISVVVVVKRTAPMFAAVTAERTLTLAFTMFVLKMKFVIVDLLEICA